LSVVASRLWDAGLGYICQAPLVLHSKSLLPGADAAGHFSSVFENTVMARPIQVRRILAKLRAAWDGTPSSPQSTPRTSAAGKFD
jgi:hypothetical protein